ncbi:hypothetical protein [Streptomyces rishiriensis]|uniref:DUF2283 domain-containing protein n=1 Tax=Streptomyces rishiriensis TaxID=68264 RepID=A0ABU0NFP9_STRRH|nr:hypothetical protein [Streptomyces rishiriensis]MDQ0577924.1 hypothetical protein [Streptomyces rishiriensis]
MPKVKLEFGDPHRRYCLTAQPAHDGRMELTVLVYSSDGIIHGELTGELGPATSATSAASSPQQEPAPPPNRPAPGHRPPLRPA